LIGGKVRLEAASTVTASDGNNVILSRSAELFIADEKGKDRARYRLQYGAKLFINDGDGVVPGQKLVEWDPYTTPIITEADGVANYMDLTDGVSMLESTDEITGFSSSVVLDWKSQPGGANLRPRITLRNDKGDVVILPNGVEARSFLSPGAILSVENGQKVSAGDVLARIW
jgi:DNA-directed RNA polymerase subunit beta'